MRRPLPLLAVVAFAVACGGSSEPEGAPPPAPESTSSLEETTTEQAPPAPSTTAPAKPKRKPKAPPGVPGFAAGYRGWIKLNEQPLPPRDSDPHNGTKDVFASKPMGANGLFPNGTVIVKEASRPGADFIGLIATMRKVKGADPEHNNWVFVEYTRESRGARYGLQAEGTVCWSCHVGATDTDYVFTLSGDF
jgi:hypothetical protein